MLPLNEVPLELLAACPAGNAAVSPLNTAMAVVLAGHLSPEGVPERWAGLDAAEDAAERAGTRIAAAAFVPTSLARPEMPDLGSREKAYTFSSEGEAHAKGDAWISEATGGLLESAPISAADQEHITLISAAGFKGTWTVPFAKSATKIVPFLAPDGEFKVPMMTRTGTMGFASGPGWRAVEIPYEGGMRFLALVRSDGTADPKALLDLSRGGFRYPKVRLALPRFSLETRLDLMGTSIGREAAGRKPYLAVEGLRGDIILEKAEHVCRVKTDEEGTVATATTEFSFLARCAMPDPVEEAVFDRPFAFALVADDGTPVFVGRIEEPERA